MPNYRVVYKHVEKIKLQCYMCPELVAQAPQLSASIALNPKSDDQ